MTKLSQSLAISLAINISVKISADPLPPPSDKPQILNLEVIDHIDRYTGISCTIEANSADTQVYLDYGTTTDYNISIKLDDVLEGSSEIRTHLIPNLYIGTWYWRIRTINSFGTTVTPTQTKVISTRDAWRTTSSIGDRDYSHVEGETYYIDFSAGTNGTGTLANPWNAWTSVVSFLDAGGGINRTNKQFLFKRGTHKEQANYGYLNALTNVVFAAYGEGNRPELFSNSVSTSSPKLLDLGGQLTNVTIHGLNMGHATDPSIMRTVINLPNVLTPGGIDISNCYLHTAQYGIRLESKTTRHMNVHLENTLIENIMEDGIYISHVGNFTIKNVHIKLVNQYWTPGALESAAAGDGIQTIRTDNNQFWGLKVDRSDTANKFCVIHQQGVLPLTAGEISTHNHCEYISQLNSLNTDPPVSSGGPGSVIYIESMGSTLENTVLMQRLNLRDCKLQGNSIDTSTSVTGIFSSRAFITSKNNTFRNLPVAFTNQANTSTITSEDDIFENILVNNQGVVTFI